MPNIPIDPQAVYTVAEVAQIEGNHPETVRRWIYSKHLDAIRLGNGPKAHVRISGAALIDYHRRQTVRAAANQPARRAS